MAKGKKQASVPLKASVPAASKKKAQVAGSSKGSEQKQQQPPAPVKKQQKPAPVKKQQPAPVKKQQQKQQAPASDTESSEEADSEASDESDDDDDDEQEVDDESDDEFEDQGSSSEDDDDDEEEDEEELTEAERKTRKFTVDREKQMQQMRDDGSLQVASQLHIDDLSSDDEETINTIGNVPLRWYEDYDHIGYDVEGQKILKSNAGGDGIDMAIAAKDDPNYEYVVRVLTAVASYVSLWG